MLMQVLAVITAGIGATFLMTLVMALIHRSRSVNADMIRALGSLWTRKNENALLPGIVIHFVFGIAFALVYAWIWSAFGVISIVPLMLTGAVIGFFHGMVVSIGLVVLVAEHHPLPRFRQVGFGVAIAHMIGHTFYGAALGLFFGLLMR